MAMTRRDALWFTSVGAIASISGCSLLTGETGFRFRMTAWAQTAKGWRSGSSIMEVSGSPQIFQTSETHPISISLRGEAIEIDLPKGPIFLCPHTDFSGPQLVSEVPKALSPISSAAPTTSDYMEQLRRLSRASSGQYRGQIPENAWPLAIRFNDLNDPRTLQVIDPYWVGVRSITVETVHRHLTDRLEKRLPWLSGVRKYERDHAIAPVRTFPTEVDYLRIGLDA